MAEKVINGILAAMEADLTDEQLQKLENVLVVQLAIPVNRSILIMRGYSQGTYSEWVQV